MDQQITHSPDTNRLTDLPKSDPFKAMREEFDSLLSRLTRNWNPQLPSTPAGGFASIDITETDDRIVVSMDVPGVTAEEIELELTGRMLHVSGQHQEEHEEKGTRYHRVERQSGSFDRTITLPCDVEEEEIQAECKNGVLKVTLPKSVKSVTRKLEVKG